VFDGMLHTHSSNVGDTMNLRTGNVSPQYHVVYVDLFTTDPNAETGGILNEMPFNQLSSMKILESRLERNIDREDERATGT
jgi:hypothetical protein